MWQTRAGWVLLVLALPGSASADPPATTVWFGPPAELASEVTITPALLALSEEPTPEAPPAVDPIVAPAPAVELAERRAVAAEPEAPAPALTAARCPGPVTVTRRRGARRERFRMPLLDCEGRPREEALRALSIMARSRSLEEEPSEEELRAWEQAEADGGQLADGVRLVDPGLLERLQRIGEAFGESPIEIISGYRPDAAPNSRHHHARALDIAIDGVPREALRDLALTLPQTGVGWYPNSVFVHVDVRDESTYWVDLSGPGEPPRYVSDTVPEAPSDASADAGAVRIDEELETIRREVRVSMPGAEIPVDGPPPSAEELDRLRSETEEALRAIHVPTG